MYAIIQWEVDGLHSIIKLRAVESPRKEEGEYMEKENVKARWRGQVMGATIIRIHGWYN